MIKLQNKIIKIKKMFSAVMLAAVVLVVGCENNDSLTPTSQPIPTITAKVQIMQ
jgi:hypothetical protein